MGDTLRIARFVQVRSSAPERQRAVQVRVCWKEAKAG